MHLVLPKASLGIPSFDKLHPKLRRNLDTIIEMAKWVEDNDRPISLMDMRINHPWRQAIEEVVYMQDPGVYQVHYLHHQFCADLLGIIKSIPHEPNEDEPLDAQIPEVVFERISWNLDHCLKSLWKTAMRPLCIVLFGLEPAIPVSVQAARYTPENTPRGCWHTDRDSECTAVVALNNDFEGGGTSYHRGFWDAPGFLPPVPVGSAMLFNGRNTPHTGERVTSGERHILVHWSNWTNE